MQPITPLIALELSTERARSARLGRASLAWPLLATAAAPSAPDSHDERLKSIRPMHFEPDDEGHTREDKARERKDREADRQLPFFG